MVTTSILAHIGLISSIIAAMNNNPHVSATIFQISRSGLASRLIMRECRLNVFVRSALKQDEKQKPRFTRLRSNSNIPRPCHSCVGGWIYWEKPCQCQLLLPRTLLRIALFYSINLFFSGFFRCLVLLYAAAAIHLNVHEDT